MSKTVTAASTVADRIETELGDEVTVTTDLADRFVYSVEKWFDEYREPGHGEEDELPDLVVRVRSNDAAKRARGLLEENGYRAVSRTGREAVDLAGADPVALIDDSGRWQVPAHLDDQARPIRKSDLRIDFPRSTDTFVQDRCAAHDVCKGYCPINETVYDDQEPFSAKGRSIISRAVTTDADSPVEMSSRVVDILYSCATCGNCFRPCTGQLDDLYEAFIEAKAEIVENHGRKLPGSIQDMLENTFRKGNPYGASDRQRDAWTEDVEVDVPVVGAGDEVEVLLWVGCAPSYDDRNQRIATSLARVFDAMALDWGILGNDETCAGNHQRAVGEIGLFELQAEENADTFAAVDYDTLVTADPHSYHAFDTEYAEEGVDLEPVHYTQFLVEHLSPSALATDHDETKTVTYHDSCYLGSHNDVTAEPRELLEWLPGYEFVDIESQALCCGGGGGRMWFEDPEVDERPASPVIDLADREAADVLAVACPFCVTNFEEARKHEGMEDDLVVRDISELLVEALEDVAE
jgi:Fe-S oxidoreductase